MIAGKNELNDVAIHWPRRRSKAISAIRRSGECPSHHVPRKLRPGGLVALVAADGEVLLLFRLARIEEHRSVIGADRERYTNGCVLIARKGSARKPRRSDPQILNVNHYGVGAFAYFNAAHQSVWYESGPGNSTRNSTARPHNSHFPMLRFPLFANNIGKTLSQPEKKLIKAYVKWVGDVTMFAHHPLKQTGLYTDIFVPRCWTLFEAKSSMARRTLREAVGQLYDYQRHYTRSPRLAVLLPAHPGANVAGLFEKRRIVVVWQSRGGAFRDSREGILTKDLRSLSKSA